MAAGEGDEKLKQPKENVNLLCSPCKRKNTVKEANNYCTDCHDYYCSTCVKCHEDIPALSGHIILDKGQFMTGSMKAIPVVPTERCERHSFKPVDMYCKNHDDVGCYTCMAVEHRSCKDIFYIPEYVQDEKNATDKQVITGDLKSVGDNLKTHLDKYKEEINRLMTRKVEEVEKVKEFREEIVRKLDELKKETVDEIEKIYKALIKKLEDDMCALTASQDDVTLSQNKISSTGSNKSQEFVSLKKAKKASVKAISCIEEKTAKFSRQDIVFERNLLLLSNLLQETYLGKLNQHHVLYKLSEKKKFNIKEESDRMTCGIYSACVIADGSVILADYSNRKLKRLDGSSYIVNGICELPTGPWQICTAENEVAVSPGGNNIIFVSVEGKMKVMREMKTDHVCYGLTYRSGSIYVTDSTRTLYVYNMTGTKLKEFSKDQSDQPLFGNIFSLAISKNGKKIYVTDIRYGLVVLDNDGKLLGKYSCPQLNSARGVCEMSYGDVLVCGYNSNNIIQFAPNGDMVGEVLHSDGGTNDCWAVYFDPGHSKLVVGHDDRDEIEI